jgi:hypothetical protein
MESKKQELSSQPVESGQAPDAPLNAGLGRHDETVPDCELQESEALQWIVSSLRQMDYPEIPSDFSASVMKGVRSRKMPWWYRVYRWARSPHTVTITPFRTAPAAVLLIACLISTVYLFQGGARLLPSRSRLVEGINVTFTLKMPGAKSVDVVGSFNDWNPRGCEMHRTDDNATWSVVTKLPAGRYEYAFLVDGTKIVSDPGGGLYQDDGFGNRNNVLVVGTNHEKAI